MMKIITYNVNGLRALSARDKTTAGPISGRSI